MDERKPGTGLVPAQNGEPQFVAVRTQEGDLLAQFDAHQSLQRTSFDVNCEQGRCDLILAKGSTTFAGLDICDKEISVRDWLIHVVTLADDETGECSTVLRLVLIDTDNKTYSTCSQSAVRGWGDVLTAFGRKSFTPPLIVRWRKNKAKKTGHFITLESVRSSQPIVKPSTRK